MALALKQDIEPPNRRILRNRHRLGQNDDDVLIVQGASRTFNATLDEAMIAAARRDDPEASKAEWEGLFRGDLSSFVDRAVVEECIDKNVRERPFLRQHRYTAFADPSGGSHDSFALAIAHREGDRAILDVLREIKAPFDPADVVTEFCLAFEQL